MPEADSELEQRRAGLRRSSRPVSGGVREPDAAELERVAVWCRENDVEADSYGEGDRLQEFEARVAGMLGHEAALFMPSGTMAQQISARIHADRRASNVIGMHPTCHLELHEERGYNRLHGLSAVFVGEEQRPMSAADLAAVPEQLAALIVELPTRENGGQLPPWEDLIELTASARDRGMAVHLDGARVWEAAAGYGRPLVDVCELFDSVYVSFYKGIGALPGSMLIGSTDFIDEAGRWKRRHGGNLYTSMANWASAAMRLDDQMAMMPTFRDRARELAAAMAELDHLVINPDPPQVNMFHVFLRGHCESLLAARDRVARDHGIWLFGGLKPTDVPNVHRFELTVRDAALDIDLEEIVAAHRALFDWKGEPDDA